MVNFQEHLQAQVDAVADARIKERRERIATAVLAGMASAHRKGVGVYSFQDAGRYALRYADTLIAELDK